MNDDATYELPLRQEAALQWLLRTFRPTGSQGSSAYFRKAPWQRPGQWYPAYPETTGYIIPTLLNYHARTKREELARYALQGADWICTLQLPDGALPGGFGHSGKASIFNTGQMLFGLCRAWEFEQKQIYLEVTEKAVRWLLGALEPDGSWKIAAYKPGYVPSYYTRVIWSILFANQFLQLKGVEEKMTVAATYYLNRLTPHLSIRQWGFDYGEKAYTHTIAYTVRGLLEAGLLLPDKALIRVAKDISAHLQQLLHRRGQLAGRYDESWKGDYYFQCLTGNAQLSVIFSKLFELTADEQWSAAAQTILRPVIRSQYLGKDPNRYGAIPGSRPAWGPYFRFAYPNWATKFFLDALYLLD